MSALLKVKTEPDPFSKALFSQGDAFFLFRPAIYRKYLYAYKQSCSLGLPLCLGGYYYSAGKYTFTLGEQNKKEKSICVVSSVVSSLFSFESVAVRQASTLPTKRSAAGKTSTNESKSNAHQINLTSAKGN